MVNRSQEPAGDYGYDLVHEVDEGAQGVAHETTPASYLPTRPVEANKELDGDYGYDEAHDL